MMRASGLSCRMSATTLSRSSLLTKSHLLTRMTLANSTCSTSRVETLRSSPSSVSHLRSSRSSMELRSRRKL
jgi:hypothetical protein